MKILTFDIEEWYLERRDHGNRAERIVEYDRLLHEILDLLDERGIKGTFFCVGGMTESFPHIVRLIDSRGHEVGCHSYLHTWLNKMTREEALDDTRRAVDSLEQCLGKKIISYRAPAFSIGQSNPWALEVLAECGIERDASIFPAIRDFGGFPGFGHKTPVIVERSGIRLKEFPISTTTILGKELAYSGGGYFRFFPLWFVRREMLKSDYAMCYFHLADLIPESSKMMSRAAYEAYFKENGSWLNRYKRHLKTNLGKRGTYAKLRTLIATTSFLNLAQADSAIDWPNTPTLKL